MTRTQTISSVALAGALLGGALLLNREPADTFPALPGTMAADSTATVAGPPAEPVAFVQDMEFSWWLDWHTYTNNPANEAGVAEVFFDGRPPREVAVVPVNYYALREVRTNSFGQPYQTLEVVPSNLLFKITVSVSNAYGMFRCFTR